MAREIGKRQPNGDYSTKPFGLCSMPYDAFKVILHRNRRVAIN